jgi:hypothetical protein
MEMVLGHMGNSHTRPLIEVGLVVALRLVLAKSHAVDNLSTQIHHGNSCYLRILLVNDIFPAVETKE